MTAHAVPQIFDYRAGIAQAHRRRANAFLVEQLALHAVERLQALKQPPRQVALLGPLAVALREDLPQVNFVPAGIDIAGRLQIGDGNIICEHIIDLGRLALVNDLPGALAQIYAALPPGGAFFSIVYGGISLREVRSALLTTETGLTGGAAPRLHPTLSGEAALQLLQRAGFESPIADRELMPVAYQSLANLARDLRDAGFSNQLTARPHIIPKRALFAESEALWKAEYPAPNGRALASFEIVALTGWKPHKVPE